MSKTLQEQDRLTEPLCAKNFAQLMSLCGKFENITSLAVAVSGGGDSMALTALLKEWGDARNIDLVALTVDHGLRTESKAEAKDVQNVLNQQGIAHDILTWDHEGDVKSSIQEKARLNRYQLLLDACRKKNIQYLAVAHNLEDQAETFLHRLAKGSGVAGLAAMVPVREKEGITLIRPLLSISHDRLLTTCRAKGVKWIEDPSNQDDKYARIRLRKSRDILTQEGLTQTRIANMAKKFARTRDYLEQQTDIALQECADLSGGVASVSHDKWLSYHSEIALLILVEALKYVSGQEYPPRSQSLEGIYNHMCSLDFKSTTLHGCLISLENKKIKITREIR